MAQVLFWGAALALLHTYFFYPLMLFAWDGLEQVFRTVRYMKHGLERRRVQAEAAPDRTVSLVVAAFNEEACIADKIANSLALDYPANQFELIIGSDGSTDGTHDRVRACRDPRVVLSIAPRAGKTSVLNRCIPSAAGDIVVLSDANTVLDRDAVKRLVRHFDDPDVGVVCGRLKLYNPRNRTYEESAYWTYESLIKFYEGKHGAVMGANGGLYAIRRRLFTAVPASTIVDDFVIPLRILCHGYRVVYDPEAIAYEETTEDYQQEFGRRARIAAGNFQSLTMIGALLLPTAGFRAFAFWSHKLLRWIAPALMALTMIGNLFLVRHRFYQATLVLQILFYALAYAGKGSWLTGRLRRAASIAYYFVTMNWAMTVGFWRFVRNSQRAAWERTARA